MKSAMLPIALFLTVTMLPANAQEGVLPPPDEDNTSPIVAPDDTSSVVETGKTLDKLFETLRKDPREASADATAKQIWREWGASGSRSVDMLMGWALRAMRDREFAHAMDLLDQVIALRPDYSEAWNRRATVNFTMQRFGRSLSDIEQTLSLEPRHFGALSGLAVIMQRLEREQEALETWYKVLEIYPANKQAQKAVIELEEKLSGLPT